MKTITWNFALPALLDPAAPARQLAAGGDVFAAVQAEQEHFLRTLAAFPEGSVSAALRFYYDPERSHPQERLIIELSGYAYEEAAAVSLGILLRQGPVQRLHRLVAGAAAAIPFSQFSAACDVLRWQGVLEATVSNEFNSQALPAYYLIRPLTPRADNDYLLLDRIFSQLREPALLEVAVAPADSTRDRSLFIRYLAHLQRMNRPWEYDDGEGSGADWGESRGHGLTMAVPPLCARDAVVDEVLRLTPRFLEKLAAPHLRFHIRCQARTPAVARLLASVVAESAFTEGSYTLFSSAEGDDCFSSGQPGSPAVRPAGEAALARLVGERRLGGYEGLGRWASLAPAQELASVFRFPLAGQDSPCCIRKETDPHLIDEKELFILGEDAQLSERSEGG